MFIMRNLLIILNSEIYNTFENDNNMAIHDTVATLCTNFVDLSCDSTNVFVNVEQIDVGQAVCTEKLEPLYVCLLHFADSKDPIMHATIVAVGPFFVDPSNSSRDACMNVEPIDTGQSTWTTDFEPLSMCLTHFADFDDPMRIDIVNAFDSSMGNIGNLTTEVISTDLNPYLGVIAFNELEPLDLCLENFVECDALMPIVSVSTFLPPISSEGSLFTENISVDLEPDLVSALRMNTTEQSVSFVCE
ncbi:uncharacterized protein LOC113318453 isoform X1 [Papaver somniferum]|uniref:uncharacterized protein LOC113318453 isoform X1 n=1 Tax=Papaver somniferum TaxID=3469 RepID=UPI000E6FBF79|nr:uncharacterized protein LOC113318453 isoform X1 [Papaver somniferum]XP_026422403.1 uncharacterized protein LOC113318453 isoform X1 [Papaver somniferum]